MIDVDRFKAFNDRYGHPAGDQILRAVGAELALCAARRRGERLSVGGEEFAILFPDIDAAGALRVAHACRRRIEALALPHALNAGGVVTVSIGLMQPVAILRRPSRVAENGRMPPSTRPSTEAGTRSA